MCFSLKTYIYLYSCNVLSFKQTFVFICGNGAGHKIFDVGQRQIDIQWLKIYEILTIRVLRSFSIIHEHV